MRLWVVGALDEKSGVVKAVCTSEEKAVSLCQEVTDFVGPVETDTILWTGGKKVEWPGAFFPLADIEGPGDESGG